VSTDRTRSWWGWGWEQEAVGRREADALGRFAADAFGLGDLPWREPPLPASLGLPEPRVTLPGALEVLGSTGAADRARHGLGRAYRDVVRALRGDVTHVPDVVARPRSESEVVSVLEWAGGAGVAVIPYGGGSSVVGGVEPDVGDGYRGTVSLDLELLAGVVELDRASRAARVRGGTYGPALEDALRPEGLTLRHFPQSFEFSTVGGWLATRAGGHYATVLTHIDDLVESIRMVTPVGISESRRLPGSGAGPSPDRWALGSEGSLGVITEAWLRLQDRPVFKASAAVHFASFDAGAEAVRGLSQSGLNPSNCRLLDSGEAAVSAGVVDGSTLLVLGFESADHPVDAWMDRAVEVCRDAGGRLPEPVVVADGAEDGAARVGRDGAVGAWRNAFVRAPYRRDAMARMSMVVETFETACTWDRFPDLHDQVSTAVEAAMREVCGGGMLTCRFTHVYPDGPAPYFSVYAPGRPGSELEQWDEIKAAASDALAGAGGTITHHHAVGRDHRRWYDRQRPAPFAIAQAASKAAVDPAAVMNPGVLMDPPG
jgi:alkyldihydroxyacetonephosphate synthase